MAGSFDTFVLSLICHTKLAGGRLDRDDGDVHEDGALLFPRKDWGCDFVATAGLKASYFLNCCT